MTDELSERVLTVNLNGVMCTMRRAISVLLAQGHGVIVKVATAAALGAALPERLTPPQSTPWSA